MKTAEFCILIDVNGSYNDPIDLYYNGTEVCANAYRNICNSVQFCSNPVMVTLWEMTDKGWHEIDRFYNDRNRFYTVEQEQKTTSYKK